MEEIVLTYRGDDFADAEKTLLFSEYQQIIREDLRRISLKVLDYEPSEERKRLLTELNRGMKDICANKFSEIYGIVLQICIHENYVAFSYYKMDKETQRLTSKPSIVIISRNMKNLYFIDEIEVLIQNKLSDCVGLCNEYEDYSLYNVESYEIGEKEITWKKEIFESYTHDVTYPCFYETEKMVEKIKTICC